MGSVGRPQDSNGPPPYVGYPRKVQTSAWLVRYAAPYAPGRPKPRPATQASTAAVLVTQPSCRPGAGRLRGY